jgi:hypothetical protein
MNFRVYEPWSSKGVVEGAEIEPLGVAELEELFVHGIGSHAFCKSRAIPAVASPKPK